MAAASAVRGVAGTVRGLRCSAACRLVPGPLFACSTWPFARLDPAAGLEPAIAEMDPLLRELERDAAIDFWGYAGLIDLRLGRQLLLLAVGRAQTPEYVGDLSALPDMLELALARWPSPSQMDSLFESASVVVRQAGRVVVDGLEPAQSSHAGVEGLVTPVPAISSARAHRAPADALHRAR